LRHKPETIGLTLDEQGWVDIDELLRAAKLSGTHLTRDILFRAVVENDKRRFAISRDGTKIRANQGHSVQVDLGLSAVEPPELLYHGTVERFLLSIQKAGLMPGSRQHVHLSRDELTAAVVGQRRGRPVILAIESRRMSLDGFDFYLSDNGVWLTNFVPVEYIRFPRSHADDRKQ
jgi:putative RNA 2'-phosphotransferase